METYLTHYLNDYQPFRPFGYSHVAAIIALLIVGVLVPLLIKRFANELWQYRFGVLLSAVVMLNFIAWYGLLFATHSFKVDRDLPFQICHYGNFLLPLVLVGKKESWYRVLYFWIMAGTLQAVITPDIQADYPHYWWWRYWLVHGGPIAGILYATIVYGFRPLPRSILVSFGWFNGVVVLTAIMNWALHSNYAYLCRKPDAQSLFDLLGPWPWYLLVTEGVALLFFGLAYVPFFMADRHRRKKIELAS